MINRKCQHCGTEFPASRKTAKYCSNACRQGKYRQDKGSDGMSKPVDSVTRAERSGQVGYENGYSRN